MNSNSFDKLELNKILASASEYASLKSSKELVCNLAPSSDIAEVRRRLEFTHEIELISGLYGIDNIEQFDDVTEILERAKKGSALSCGELLGLVPLMRSARVAYNLISKIDNPEIVKVVGIAKQLYFDEILERDITEKIISPDTVSDRASEKLFYIRTKIKNLNDRIRAKLSEYITGKNAEYLQEAIVTIRNERYVIPVKAEHKSHVKGFIHDRSKTGATFFIEPEYVLELNNELVALSLDEREEIEAILRALSARAGKLADELIRDQELLTILDAGMAMEKYSYARRCVLPKVNNRGYINIIKGRHPLLKGDVVPVSVEIGSSYNFLLLSGANTGGKTVTLKMVGLFCLMAACGLFIPAVDGSSVAVFDNVFCDIGDSQSIEESLSTFSSHLSNIIFICNAVTPNCLVLIDELGGGTNPDEGQALAKAIVKKLLSTGCKGIVTTHFTPLKEYAYITDGIENASMEFDPETLHPLYTIKIGLPGASNALAIARRLGLDPEILNDALSFLSEGARSFENIIQSAEASRVEAERKLSEAEEMKLSWESKLNVLNRKTDELNREREKIAKSARVESRRIISERTERAEQLLSEIEDIFKKEQISESDLIRARTLKNKLKDTAFEESNEKNKVNDFIAATADNIHSGVTVFIKPTGSTGKVVNFNKNKNEAEILSGNIRMHIKLKDLQIVGDEVRQEQNVKFIKNISRNAPVLEINVLGMNVVEALSEVDNFIDKAVTDNLDEIKIIHGVGTGKLRNAISEHLKKHKNVESFRPGKYGEGEMGVTFIKLR